MEATEIRLLRGLPIALSLGSLTLVAMCVAAMFDPQSAWIAIAFTPFALIAAVVCALPLLENPRLRVGPDGVSVRGLRHHVAFTWPEIRSVGIARSSGTECLAVWLAPGVKPPAREKWLYPSWSPRVGAVIIGRLDMWDTTRSEFRAAISNHAPDKWRDDSAR
ncbi:PH domain-containing protein [Thermasporomyces composti]|uniref:PH (Pleckstrin Homology) domain-containing protein n=1 Tax=Thermasporomyces composti TaxID=696763 RepID=A0A3D9V2H5_THECX|nr:PH domain-containing protein [Thermasporomyces composti]REF35727.1 PH (Pleckstrin Homology) domain-containing protein [Thermasporomyces composti]